MSKFMGTPGPWIADGDEIFSEDTDSHIAVISSWLNEDITDANATLIAAAPEMFEALQELIHADCHSVRNSTVHINALTKASHAIAKALGQAPQ